MNTTMRLRSRPGVALMLVLWLIVVLATICSSVVLAARSTTSVAGNYRARVAARYAAESGINVAVAVLEDSLARLGDSPARRLFLNDLANALGSRHELLLAGARTAVSLVDVNARLDVNLADESALATLFAYFVATQQAESLARAIREHITGAAAGEPALLQAARPLRSLDELRDIPGMPAGLARRLAHFLTVDGDGTINRMTASDTVMAAARGGLLDEPARILIVSRGSLVGHPLVHEIEAVYALAGMDLVLVRWRERDL
jgi:type II secretory pathway component PulK